ncbi:MAG: hypothetical protein Q8P51_13430 [Ignavibacteria bacterium]|nr:hypothetical protein [Ignavibacteria bacterium]
MTVPVTPFRSGPVNIEFDAVTVRIGKVQSFAHAVVGKSLEGPAMESEPLQNRRKVFAARIEKREVKETG